MRKLRSTAGGWAWITALGLAAATAMGGPCGSGNGPCDQPNGTPGCDDVECCELICGQDPFCCNTEWDQICADAAIEQCVLPGPMGACCIDTTCIMQTEADCVDLGGDYQGDGVLCTPEVCVPSVPCNPDAGACDVPNGTPGCDDVECCELICSQDPFCCDTEWDQVCADAAIKLCSTPDPIGACCFVDMCLDVSEEECVSAKGVFQGAGTSCDQIQCIPTGACLIPHTFECTIETMRECKFVLGGIYLGDDSDCPPVPEACNPDAGPCNQPNGTPGCSSSPCCQIVCFQDAFCCDVEWDAGCVETAMLWCDLEPPTGACCLTEPSPFCQIMAEDECQQAGGVYQGHDVPCTPDPCVCPCNWDLDGNCVVDAADLATMLANWNTPYGPSDLAALLAEWNCSG